MQKRLNRSRCRLGCGRGCRAQGGARIHTGEGAILEVVPPSKMYCRKWLHKLAIFGAVAVTMHFRWGTTPKIAPSPGAPTDSVWSQQYRGPTGVVIVRRLYMCIYAKKDFETTNCTDGCMQTITMDDVTDPRH